MSDTVRDSVIDAFNAQTQGSDNEAANTGGKQEETVEETQESTKKSPEEESGGTDDRVKQALAILDILEDPARQRKFVKALAVNFEEETKDSSPKDVKTAAKDLLDDLKSAIGEENAYLLQPIMTVVNKVVADSEQKILSTLQAIELKRQKSDLENRYQSFIERNEISQEEQQLMQELAKDLPPSPDISLESYLTRLRRVAKAELSEKQEKVNKNSKIEENKKKTQFNRTPASNNTNGDRPIINTARDAVMAAVRELTEKG